MDMDREIMDMGEVTFFPLHSWWQAYLMGALEGVVFDMCIIGDILGGLHLRGLHWSVMIRYFHGLKLKTKAGHLGFKFYLDRNQRVERDR